jgi:hypothetical protein
MPDFVMLSLTLVRRQNSRFHPSTGTSASLTRTVVKSLRRRAAFAVLIAALLAIAPIAAATAASTTTPHPGHTATGPDTAKKYKVTVKFGKAKAPGVANPEAAQAGGCAPPLVSFSRTRLCLVYPAEVEVVAEENGEPVAGETYSFGVEADLGLSAASTSMVLEGTIIGGSAVGDLPEPVPVVTISATCAPCLAVAPLLVIGGPSGGSSSTGIYNAVTHPNQVVRPALLIEMYAEAGGTKSGAASAPVPGTRCDDMYPGQWRPGCVFPAFIPTVDMSGLPVIAKNIGAVQGRGIHVGQPGGSHPLHRGSSKQEATNNRNLVCPKSLKRPPGDTCDEYPFASTVEGGTALPAVDRYVGWVPAKENQEQGNILSAFYRTQRILRGNPGDAFYVNV